MIRFSGGDVLRFVRAHLIAAVIAGLAFSVVRTGLAITALPGIGAIGLLVVLASVQAAIVGAGAAIIAILAASAWPRLAGVIFPVSGAAVGLVLSALVEQINLTFLAPALVAGVAYGLAMVRLAWRPAIATP